MIDQYSFTQAFRDDIILNRIRVQALGWDVSYDNISLIKSQDFAVDNPLAKDVGPPTEIATKQ